MKDTAKKSHIQIEDAEYAWFVRGWPSWCWNHQDYNGLTLEIELVGDRARRPLVVEFPMERKPNRKPPKQQPLISDKLIAHLIAQAITLGWNPNSRGQIFTMEVDLQGN